MRAVWRLKKGLLGRTKTSLEGEEAIAFERRLRELYEAGHHGEDVLAFVADSFREFSTGRVGLRLNDFQVQTASIADVDREAKRRKA